MSRNYKRLSKIARELGVSVSEIAEILESKNIFIKAHPNTKLHEKVYTILYNQDKDKENDKARVQESNSSISLQHIDYNLSLHNKDMSLLDFSKKNNLDIELIINKLNRLIGFSLWKSNSIISVDQITTFKRMNWNSDSTKIINISSSISKQKLKYMYLPKKFHRTPNSLNIEIFMNKLNITRNYQVKESISSYIINVLGSENIFNSIAQEYFHDYSNYIKQLKKNLFPLLSKLLEQTKEENSYNSELILRIGFAEFLSKDQSLINLSDYINLDSFDSFPITFKNIKQISFYEWIKCIKHKRTEIGLCHYLNLLNYFYKVNLLKFDDETISMVNLIISDDKLDVYDFIWECLWLLQTISGKEIIRTTDKKLKFIDQSKSTSVRAILTPMGKK